MKVVSLFRRTLAGTTTPQHFADDWRLFHVDDAAEQQTQRENHRHLNQQQHCGAMRTGRATAFK
jgi:hypothetical protein